jgi:acyl-CoA synthetase (NDP forming)
MKMLPPHAPLPRNPVDFAGGYRTAMDEASTVEVLMKLDYIDAVITNVPVNRAIRYNSMTDNKLVEQAIKISEEGTRYLCSLPYKYGKPVVCVRLQRSAKKYPFENMLVESGVPVYDTPEQCARAMYALTKYADIRSRA